MTVTTASPGITPPRSMRKRMIGLFVLFVTLTVGTLTLLTTLFLSRHMEQDRRNDLVNMARHHLLRMEERLALLTEHTRRLADNHFILNALMDPQGQGGYLPKIAANFIAGRDVMTFALVDFDGNPVFEQGQKVPEFNRSPSLRQALSMGRLVTAIDATGQRLEMVVPVQYYQTIQGALLVTFDLQAMAQHRLPVGKHKSGAEEVVFTWMTKDRILFTIHQASQQAYLTEEFMAD
ncbi:MAG: hypothetical protein H7838_13555, partial [Magnetococcus sp. DMHC-8]